MSTRRAPGEAEANPPVRIGTEQDRTTHSELNSASGEATSRMKPEKGRDQATMQMKPLSPEKAHITEADTVHGSGRPHGQGIALGEIPSALSGSESVAWSRRDSDRAWETQGEPRKPMDTRRAASETKGIRVGDDKPLKARSPR